MKRCLLVCREAEEEERSIENPFLVLPRELVDTILTFSNYNRYYTRHMDTINFFASLLRLHLVDRASYSQFESIRKLELLSVLNNLGLTYATTSEWRNYGDCFLIWRGISRLALCHDAYRETIDEFFEERQVFESRFIAYIMRLSKEHIHASQYNDMSLSISHIRNHYMWMTRAQQRRLAYHCAAMFKYDRRERTVITHVNSSTSLSSMYVYSHEKCVNSESTYLVSLESKEAKKIDVRYLVPLSLPLAYSNNETLYAVENPPPPPGLYQLLHKKGSLALPLHIRSLLNCINDANAFRECLIESRQAIQSAKKETRKRNSHIPSLGDTHNN